MHPAIDVDNHFCTKVDKEVLNLSREIEIIFRISYVLSNMHCAKGTSQLNLVKNKL